MTEVTKSGPPVAKILLGCGCLAIIIAGVTLATLGGIGFFASKKLYDENKEVLQEGAKAFKDLKQASKRAQDAKGRDAQAPQAQEAPAIEAKDMLAWVSAPLDPEQVRAHLKFMTTWESSKSVKEFNASVKKLQDQRSGDKGAAEKVRALSQGISFYSNLSEASQEFDELAKRYGGVNAVLQRTFVAIALTSAARDLSEHQELKDPASDKVAKLMVSERDKYKALFDQLLEAQRQRIELAKLMSEGGDQAKLEPLTKKLEAEAAKSKEATELVSSAPGLLLLGRVDERSLKTWSSLSTTEREELLKVASTLPTIPQLMMIPQIQSQRLLSSWLVGAELSIATTELFKDEQDEP